MGFLIFFKKKVGRKFSPIFPHQKYGHIQKILFNMKFFKDWIMEKNFRVLNFETTGGHSRGSPSVSCIEKKYNRMDDSYGDRDKK